MEKLIDLLNEYEKEKTDLTFEPHFWDAYKGHLTFLEYNSKYSDLLCISKRYGFIGWLVEKDKIDESKIFCDQGLYYSLLCKLAISDNPISDLISYLK